MASRSGRFQRFDEVYQLAADMGGAGYIFSGESDADIMHNSATINLNVLDACRRRNARRIFYLVLGLHLSGAQSDAIPTIQTVRRTAPIRQRRTANTDGRSCSASGSISPMPAITAWRCGSPAYHNIFGPEGSLERRPRKSAGGALPKDGDGPRRRRDRDLGRWAADALVPIHR